MNTLKKIVHVATAIALTIGVTAAIAQVNMASSTVTATAKQIGVPMTGAFKKFTADIKFDPANLPQSSAKLTVDVGSYDLGMPDYNKEVTGKAWFNAAQFPSATFVSANISAVSAGIYKVSGKLTLKGKTIDVTVPVTVKIVGAIQTFDGALPIKRNDFSIGENEWKDTSIVADEVIIKFHLVVTAAK